MSRHPSKAPCEPVIIVGAGPAGLATAAAVQREGLPAVVLEEAPEIARTWRRGYDRLRLNTSRLTSRLAGTSYPRGAALFPSRDVVVEYLEAFARRHRIAVRTRTRVERIDPSAAGWMLQTSAGTMTSADVVVATGYANRPFIPSWPGREQARVRVLHAAHYRNPTAFRARHVLVAGAGSSGMEIAHDLAIGGAESVRLAVRTPPNIVLRTVAGLPGDLAGVALLSVPPQIADRLERVMRRAILGDLSACGLPHPAEGPFTRLRRLGVAASVVDREVVQAVVDGRIEIVGAVDAFDGAVVRLSGGRLLKPHAVIAATGYRCGLEPLIGHLDVLDPRGVPRVVGGDEALPGLRFVGFVPRPGQFRTLSREAQRAARGIARRAHQGDSATPREVAPRIFGERSS